MSRLPDAFVEEVKARIRPSDLIGRTVQLKRQGREFVGLSPFTKERSPSFFVNDDKGFYHCFSSGKHGDVIDFLVEMQRLDWREAIEQLASEAGLQMPEEDPAAAAREERRKGLADWLDLAQKWFSHNLQRQAGAEVRAYLEKRGLPADQWERFGLGYAPADREGLKLALLQRGAKTQDLVDAGLLIAPEGGGHPYDRFRDRLMFPILDHKGRLVSFGGRAMNPDDRAKYLNGPETGVFHKGATLYGLSEARRIMGDQPLVVVEGYMDVIACQRANIPAVAPMGTALTEDQMALLWRTSREPVLCFDGDKAGRRAAFRVTERALPLLKAGHSFQFALLEAGKDPDDILRDHGADALRAAVNKTRPFVDVLFQKELDQEPADTPERKAGLKDRLQKAARLIQDRDLAEIYRGELMDRFFRLTPARKPRTQQGFKAPEAMKPQSREAVAALANSVDPLAASLALAALDTPSLLETRMETVAQFGFGDAKLMPLASAMISASMVGEGVQLQGTKRVQLEAAAARLGMDFSDPERWGRAVDTVALVMGLDRALEKATGRDIHIVKAERDRAYQKLKSGEGWAD